MKTDFVYLMYSCDSRSSTTLFLNPNVFIILSEVLRLHLPPTVLIDVTGTIGGIKYIEHLIGIIYLVISLRYLSLFLNIELIALSLV